ncbi:glyoxalase [Streptomyces sp. NPDC046385]|uniref:glyoxalase n=1 Tax=Streptomyces sp. NPDC046385 TaxID=3154918 RepID=UPI0033C833D1
MLIAVDPVRLAAPAGSEDLLRASCAGDLGLTEIPEPPVLAAGGAVRLHPGEKPGFRPARKAGPGPRAAGMRDFAARLERHGGTLVRDDSHRPEFLEPVD